MILRSLSRYLGIILGSGHAWQAMSDPICKAAKQDRHDTCKVIDNSRQSYKTGFQWFVVRRFLLKFYLGIPEPQWVTQKLKKSTQLLGIGTRYSCLIKLFDEIRSMPVLLAGAAQRRANAQESLNIGHGPKGCEKWFLCPTQCRATPPEPLPP